MASKKEALTSMSPTMIQKLIMFYMTKRPIKSNALLILTQSCRELFFTISDMPIALYLSEAMKMIKISTTLKSIWKSIGHT